MERLDFKIMEGFSVRTNSNTMMNLKVKSTK